MDRSPDPPEGLPEYLVDGLESQTVDALRDAASYAEALAEWKQAQADRRDDRADDLDAPDEWDDDKWSNALDEARDKADLRSGKGTLTTKTIDERDYYYLQWSEGSKTRSQYVAPVNPAGD